MNHVHVGEWCAACVEHGRGLEVRDTGPRPDSGIDAWPHKPYRCCSIHYPSMESEVARLSTPRTETSEPELEELIEEQRREDERNERLQSEMDSAGYWP